jgi:glycosyltransferase involved in cell wall biosynthesis
MEERARVLVISHGHPDVTPGGAEHAAHSLFRELQSRPNTSALFLARGRGGHRDAVFHQHSEDGSEVLIDSQSELFRFSQRDKELLCTDFRRFLEWYRPTLVHLHHFVHLGIEILREIRNYSRTVPIVLTLHEYMAICHQEGQMVRTQGEELCRKATPGACHGCFPAIDSRDFFLRELYLKSFLALVDTFISPSQFLVERYVAWGLPREKFVVIENGVRPVTQALGSARIAEQGARRRFAFFGHFSRYKGLHVLLDAVSYLPPPLRNAASGVSLEVHGAHLPWQTEEYQAKIRGQLEQTGKMVQIYGRYEHADLSALMRNIDWVVVPSVWWENSPLVIQEAFAHGRPVICSDIGGMAEKVQDGVNGLHFRVGNARHLRDRMLEAATTEGLWDKLRSGIKPPFTVADSVDRHLELYAKLWSGRKASSSAALRLV